MSSQGRGTHVSENAGGRPHRPESEHAAETARVFASQERRFQRRRYDLVGDRPPVALAIIHAPGRMERDKVKLTDKLRHCLGEMGFAEGSLLVNPGQEWERSVSRNGHEALVVGWGLDAEPDWRGLVQAYPLPAGLACFTAVDLLERRRTDGRPFEKPKIDAGRYWARKSREGMFEAFLAGHFVSAVPPFGMKKTPVKVEDRDHPRYILEPGEPQEAEIVQLIYDLHANYGYPRSKICNLLNAQGVESPGPRPTWSPVRIDAILTDTTYIGANRHEGCVRFDVFTPIVAKATFYRSQARLHVEHITKRVGAIDGWDPEAEDGTEQEGRENAEH